MKIVSRVVKTTKRPVKKNLERGNFCLTDEDVKFLQPGDKLRTTVKSGERVVAIVEYEYEELMKQAKPWTKEDECGTVIA
jgi:hypothetical protein